jgi:hypothetical protein
MVGMREPLLTNPEAARELFRGVDGGAYVRGRDVESYRATRASA